MLPVESAIPPLRAALARHGAAVLQAPPGAGKTTRVPLALLDESWLAGRKIVMLEPRRLAARGAAHYMARLRGERVGETIGHRVRLDVRVGPYTRVEVVTEGILARLLQDDPTLDGIGLVIFDEYHERSLHADLGLALVLQTRELLRDDLRVLVMSATLDGAAVARLLGDAPVVTSEGRSFPVETRWLPRADARDQHPAAIAASVAAATRRALAEHAGSVLAFLPGAGEIRRAESLLRDGPLPGDVDVLALHGALAPDAQDAAIAPPPAGRRKVVLATSIAETSLTIDGIGIVIDSGFSRVPRFSPRTGMTRLETVRASRAAADQRRGRAGRLGPGVCYRLWHEHEEGSLAAFDAPEILEADLAPLALSLADAGVADPLALRWLDAPPAAAFAQARELLVQLGAIEDAGGRVTPHGRRMASLGLHPRLAHMSLACVSAGLGALACELAALLEERDVLRADGPAFDADLRHRVDVLRGGAPPPGFSVDREHVRRTRALADEHARRLGVERRGAREDVAHVGVALLHAYPDRVARRRTAETGAGRWVTRGGQGAYFAEPQPLSAEPWLVVAELDGRRPDSRIFLAAAVDEADVLRHAAPAIVVERAVEWDDDAHAVRARDRTRLGAIVLRDVPARDVDADDVARALLEGLRRAGIDALPWSDAARALRRRVAFLRGLDPAWPDLSDEALLHDADTWLLPRLHGLARLDDLRRVDLAATLLDRLTWEQRARLDELAPTHLVVPSGSRVPVDYAEPEAPALAVRLQELFGLTDSPRIGGGRVPVTLRLLSPAHRPVQVTRDLASFWRTSYFDVRKDLRGRYPKHHWPEDPLRAEPTARAKRRG